MVIVAQLVRAPDCGSGGRGFEPRLSPLQRDCLPKAISFFFNLKAAVLLSKDSKISFLVFNLNEKRGCFASEDSLFLNLES